MGGYRRTGGGSLATRVTMLSKSPVLVALLIVIESVIGQVEEDPLPLPPLPAAVTPAPAAAAAPAASPLLPAPASPPVPAAAAASAPSPAASPAAASPPAAPAAAAAAASPPELLTASAVTGEKEDEELNRLLAMDGNVKPAAEKDEGEQRESSRVKEAALDDKLGIELRSIVEQIQDMQREVADALKDGGDV